MYIVHGFDLSLVVMFDRFNPDFATVLHALVVDAVSGLNGGNVFAKGTGRIDAVAAGRGAEAYATA